MAAVDPLDLLALAPQRYPVLLASSGEHASLGRHDLLPASDGRHLRLDRDGRVRDQDDRDLGDDFAAALDAAWRDFHDPDAGADAEPAPFAGGWLLYLGYEMAAQFEPRLRLPAFTEGALPLALAVRTPVVWSRDRATGQARVHARPDGAALSGQLALDLQGLGSVRESPRPRMLALHEDDPKRFLESVRRIHDYLAAGDVFQVNLSRAWRAGFDAVLDPVALFRRLRDLSPSPFSALLRWNGDALLSASPERLVAVRGERIETRPIAGTRPRADGAVEDAQLRAELLAHPKERAEHVMLIDLERNDLGRLCVPGSVRVEELMALESYSHVHHLVSNVAGRLRPGTTPGAVLRAMFPGGTITGCPKVRCMEIIAELEQVGRGPYTGALGYLDDRGDLDLNILIRTAWTSGRTLGFRTGAGIVVDSVPERELAETRAKAGGLLALLAGDAAAAPP